MHSHEKEYALEPTAFHSMQEAQELADALEESLGDQDMGAPMFTLNLTYTPSLWRYSPSWSTTPPNTA